MENDKLVRLSDVERWILTETASLDTPADRDAVVERMRCSIPAVDAVEVVRCADCKYYHTEWDGTQEHYEDDYWCQWVEPNEEDYCSLGKRRWDGDGDG